MFVTRTHEISASVDSLSAFIPKYSIQNLMNSLVAELTMHGQTLSRPVDSWVAFGDQATAF